MALIASGIFGYVAVMLISNSDAHTKTTLGWLMIVGIVFNILASA